MIETALQGPSNILKPILATLQADGIVSIDEWMTILSLQSNDKKKIYQKLRHNCLDFCWYDPSLAYLELPHYLHCHRDLWEIFEICEKKGEPEVYLLCYLLLMLHLIFL